MSNDTIFIIGCIYVASMFIAGIAVIQARFKNKRDYVLKQGIFDLLPLIPIVNTIVCILFIYRGIQYLLGSKK